MLLKNKKYQGFPLSWPDVRAHAPLIGLNGSDYATLTPGRTNSHKVGLFCAFFLGSKVDDQKKGLGVAGPAVAMDDASFLRLIGAEPLFCRSAKREGGKLPYAERCQSCKRQGRAGNCENTFKAPKSWAFANRHPDPPHRRTSLRLFLKGGPTAGKETVPIDAMSVQEEGAPTSGKEEAASVEEEAPSMSRNYVSVEEAEGRKSLKRKRASEDVACATAGKEDDGAGKAMVEHAPPATVYVALPPTCSLSHVFFLLFLLSSFFLKQAVALVGEFQRLQEAKAEIQRLQDVISEKTGEVSVLSLRLKSALRDVTKLKKSKVHSQKTVAQFWSSSPAATGTTTETGIQTETETAVGATDVYQLLDVELQLGLAAVYDQEKMVDRSENPGYPRTITGRHLH